MNTESVTMSNSLNLEQQYEPNDSNDNDNLISKGEVDKQKVQIFKDLTNGVITKEQYATYFEWLDNIITREVNTTKELFNDFIDELKSS